MSIVYDFEDIARRMNRKPEVAAKMEVIAPEAPGNSLLGDIKPSMSLCELLEAAHWPAPQQQIKNYCHQALPAPAWTFHEIFKAITSPAERAAAALRAAQETQRLFDSPSGRTYSLVGYQGDVPFYETIERERFER